jgi:hypothetical protein
VDGSDEQTVPARMDVVTHEVSGTEETVLYDDQGHRLLVLNDVGAAVWYLVDGRRSVGEIVQTVVEALPAERGRVERDVMQFLEALRSHGLVRF